MTGRPVTGAAAIADGGRRQRWCADGYARHARFVADHGAPLVELLAPRPGERILDLGCGDGALTHRISAAGAEVVGVDASFDMAAAARRAGVAVVVMDGERLAFARPFDAVFSNAALHWMIRPDAVLAGVAACLAPGGRFVGELGGFGNVRAIMAAVLAAMAARGQTVPAAAWPWVFPTAADYRRRLADAGFVVASCQLIDRPTRLDTDLVGWLVTFAGAVLDRLPAAERPAVIAEVADRLAPTLFDGRHWWADYVRLRFVACRSAAAAFDPTEADPGAGSIGR